MSSPRLVRGTKGRLFACLGVLTLFAGVLFLYHSTRVELDEVRTAASKCHQEQDSLAAQVQVITEYKVRLEKSLQQEKAEHRQTKEGLQSRMTDEQQKNLEYLNKYKALQQQYKLLQSEHEDLNEYFTKMRSEKETCTDALTQLEAKLATMQQELNLRDSASHAVQLHSLKLIEDNKKLSQKLAELQSAFSQEHIKKISLAKKEESLLPPDTNQLKKDPAWGKGSSTKETNQEGAANGDDNAAGNQAGYLEPPNKLHPAAPSSSTATQERNLLPARPAQAAPLQSVPSNKTSSKHSTTPQINPDAVQSQEKASLRGYPPLPLLLSPHHHFSNGESHHNDLQGVLPAPLGFGNEIQAQQQRAMPLQAPYRQQRGGNLEPPQNQGQMPPIAPMEAASHNEVLPAPPGHSQDFIHLPNFDPMLVHNMNPFQNELKLNDKPAAGLKLKNQKSSSFHGALGKNVYHMDNIIANPLLNAHDPVNMVFDINDPNRNDASMDANKRNAVQDIRNLGYMANNNQYFRPGGLDSYPQKNIVPILNKDKLHAMHLSGGQAKPFKLIPLDGDVNQHGELERPAGDDFDLGPHPVHLAAKNPHSPGRQEIPHGLPYNYQGGDYDKEEQEHAAQGDDGDDDVDPIDYNDQANHGQHAKKVVHRRFAVPQFHHHDRGLVNPR